MRRSEDGAVDPPAPVGSAEVLTTVEDWEGIWARCESGGFAAGLRRRLASNRDWAALTGMLLDAPGNDGPMRVLELGAAPGTMLLQMLELRPHHEYSGIDNVRSGLEIARRRIATRGRTARLHHGDVRTAQLPPADLVVSFGLIEHFSDPAGILAHHRRLTVAGGTVAVTVPNYAHPTVTRLLSRFCPGTLDRHNRDIMSPAAMRAALTEAGLIDVRAGSHGGPILPTMDARRGPLGRGYSVAARTWNVSSALFPRGWPWAANIWGLGVNPG